MTIQRKGILQAGDSVRISKTLRDEMGSLAAEQGRTLPPIRNTEDFLSATLATMDEEMLDQIETIFDDLSAKYARDK